jgi:hypothetical protein
VAWMRCITAIYIMMVHKANEIVGHKNGRLVGGNASSGKNMGSSMFHEFGARSCCGQGVSKGKQSVFRDHIRRIATARKMDCYAR